jgi:hypothetical protein
MKFLITCRLWKTEGGRTDNHIKYELDSELRRCGFFLIHNSQLACGKYLSRPPLLIGFAPSDSRGGHPSTQDTLVLLICKVVTRTISVGITHSPQAHYNMFCSSIIYLEIQMGLPE